MQREEIGHRGLVILTVRRKMKKSAEYYRIAEFKEIHITKIVTHILLHMECGKVERPHWNVTKCFRPNSLDAICRGCRGAW